MPCTKHRIQHKVPLFPLARWHLTGRCVLFWCDALIFVLAVGPSLQYLLTNIILPRSSAFAQTHIRMRVSTKENRRPALVERTNPSVPKPFVQSKNGKRVSFSTHPACSENVPVKETKGRASKSTNTPQSALRPTGRYSKGRINKNPPTQTTSVWQRFAPQREDDFEPDAATLRQCIALLKTKLSEAEEAHQETLIQIEEQKKCDMAKIYRECVARHKKVVREEEETSTHDNDVIRETIDTLRDHNNILRNENTELTDDINEIENENRRLIEQINRYKTATEKVKLVIMEQQKRNDELQGTVDFLIMRRKEYEDAKFEADQDIEAEREEAVELRKKLESVVAEIERRASQRAFAEAVRVAVWTDLATVDGANSSRAIPA